MEEDIILEEKVGYVTTLVINRPERRNALNIEALTKLTDILNRLGNDKSNRVVILRGAGEQAFCSGMELGGTGSAGSILQQLKDAVANYPYPIIAMIYGFALGAGCDLAFTCDFRFAADNIKIGINPVKLGWTYEYNSIYRFIKLIGAANAKELFLTGRFFGAHRAKEMGLVNYVYPVAELAAATRAFANELADNAPQAMAGTKFIFNRLLEYPRISTEDGAEMRTIAEKLLQSEDAKEGRRAFAEKRKPDFQGR